MPSSKKRAIRLCSFLQQGQAYTLLPGGCSSRSGLSATGLWKASLAVWSALTVTVGTFTTEGVLFRPRSDQASVAQHSVVRSGIVKGKKLPATPVLMHRQLQCCMSASDRFVFACQGVRFLAASTIALQSSTENASGSSASSGTCRAATATWVSPGLGCKGLGSPGMCCLHLPSSHLPQLLLAKLAQKRPRHRRAKEHARGGPAMPSRNPESSNIKAKVLYQKTRPQMNW